jgi:hypothetical protein
MTVTGRVIAMGIVSCSAIRRQPANIERQPHGIRQNGTHGPRAQKQGCRAVGQLCRPPTGLLRDLLGSRDRGGQQGFFSVVIDRAGNMFTTLDPNVGWCFDSDADSTPAHFDDADHDPIPDVNCLSQFPRKDQHKDSPVP